MTHSGAAVLDSITQAYVYWPWCSLPALRLPGYNNALERRDGTHSIPYDRCKLKRMLQRMA